MRNMIKLSRFVVGLGLSPGSNILPMTATTLRYPPDLLDISNHQHPDHRRCFSRLLSHSHPVSLPRSSLRDAGLPLSFSRYSVFLRNFNSAAKDGNRLSAKFKSEPALEESGEETEKNGEVNLGEGGDVQLRRTEEEGNEDSLDDDRPSSKKKSPPEGEIGFVEGKIDQIQIIDVGRDGKTAVGKDDGQSITIAPATGKKKEKKKSSDLQALEKFDIIVSGEGRSDLALEKEPPRTFQLADDDRSILEPPDEPMALRKRPELAQDDVIDPKRKQRLIGDRKKPPKFNFSLRHALFEETATLDGGKTKRSFEMAIKMFCKADPKYRRGHVEMVYQAANLLKEYGLEKDLDAYKMIFDLFPKGVLIPKGALQAGFSHYPRQQDCAVQVLVQMEFNRVMPDNEVSQQLVQIFGRRSDPHRRIRRMAYWMPKFRYASPFPLVPVSINKEDSLSVAKRLLERICVDLENEITVHRVQRPEEDPVSFNDLPWIASAISPKQRELISRLPTGKPIYVKGPFPVFLRGRKAEHFTLWAELPVHLKEYYDGEEELFEDYMRQSKDIDELMDSDVARQAFRGSKRKNALAGRPSLHEQEDGIILALSVLESFSKEHLTSWIKFLEESNPHLTQVPVIFSLNSAPPSDLVVQQEQTDSVAMKR